MSLSSERTFDLRLDVSRIKARLDGNAIGDSNDTAQVLYGVLGGGPLILPFNFAIKRHPAVLDQHLHSILWDRGIEDKAVDSRLRDVEVAAYVRTKELDFQLVGYTLDTRHAPHRPLGIGLLRIAQHRARQGHDPVLHGNANL